MQIRATVIKLLTQYVPDQLLRHIANEVEEQGRHYLAVGAPIRADYAMRQAAVIREAAKALDALPYRTSTPVLTESTIDENPKA